MKTFFDDEIEHGYYPGKATWKDYLLIAGAIILLLGLILMLADVVFGAENVTEAIAGVIN